MPQPLAHPGLVPPQPWVHPELVPKPLLQAPLQPPLARQVCRLLPRRQCPRCSLWSKAAPRSVACDNQFASVQWQGTKHILVYACIAHCAESTRGGMQAIAEKSAQRCTNVAASGGCVQQAWPPCACRWTRRYMWRPAYISTAPLHRRPTATHKCVGAAPTVHRNALCGTAHCATYVITQRVQCDVYTAQCATRYSAGRPCICLHRGAPYTCRHADAKRWLSVPSTQSQQSKARGAVQCHSQATCHQQLDGSCRVSSSATSMPLNLQAGHGTRGSK